MSDTPILFCERITSLENGPRLHVTIVGGDGSYYFTPAKLRELADFTESGELPPRYEVQVTE